MESAYISFMMKELIFSHILDFNPSCIVVSYSQKLRIEEEVFVDLVKELTVLANYKVVFYATTGSSVGQVNHIIYFKQS